MATLRVLDTAVSMVAEVMTVVRRVEGVDRDLARQLKRAAMSAAAQIGEADEARKGNKVAKLQGALAEAREVKVWLRLAVAVGYVTDDDAARSFDLADHVCAVLFKIVRRLR